MRRSSGFKSMFNSKECGLSDDHGVASLISDLLRRPHPNIGRWHATNGVPPSLHSSALTYRRHGFPPCLDRRDDHLIVFNDAYLHHVLNIYATYYETIPAPLDLRKDAPLGRFI